MFMPAVTSLSPSVVCDFILCVIDVVSWLDLNLFFSCCFCNRFIHGGQFLNGLAGPTIMSAGPYLSTTWFAPDQRATATAVASLFSYLGSAASFIVGPLVVPAPNDTLTGTTMAAAVSDNSIRDRIQLVMYAGTNSKQEPLRARRINSTSFQHHVGAVKGHENTIRRRDPGILHQHQKKPPIIIFITTTLKNRLLALLCFTDSEN